MRNQNGEYVDWLENHLIGRELPKLLDGVEMFVSEWLDLVVE